MTAVILPGTYVTVRDEGLITAGAVSTGNVGIVGTANKGAVGEVAILGGLSEARELFGAPDAWQGGSANELTLMRALEPLYNNGGRTVYAVRVASNAAQRAAYQLADNNGNLAKLEAVSPGTWGNDIRVAVEAADEASLISEQLAGDAASLNRTKVVKDGPLNQIRVRQAATGQVLAYKIVYDVAPNDAAAEVGVNTTSGALTFTALAGFAPTAADTIVARYQVPKASSKRVELRYEGATETYTVADASHLAEQINARSRLVGTAANAEEDFYNRLPANLDPAERFGTGLSGHTAGGNGEAASVDDYKAGLAKLENEAVNLVLLAGQPATDAQMVTALLGHLNTTAQIKRERIGVIGSDGGTQVDPIAAHTLNHDRLIFVAPGLQISPQVTLPGSYTAAAVAGLLSSLPVQTSPTNKALAIPGLAVAFSPSQLEKLVQARVLAVERREGFRVVKGITTATNSAWHQITTRRIVDYAVYGVRSAANPYIGKLNNSRVRSALKATLDGFLTRMVENEALVSYELEVSATRAQEIAGEAIVTMTIRPTFSIDFVRVTIFLA